MANWAQKRNTFCRLTGVLRLSVLELQDDKSVMQTQKTASRYNADGTAVLCHNNRSRTLVRLVLLFRVLEVLLLGLDNVSVYQNFILCCCSCC